ncbi:MAG TPA: hypothetical protein EYQ63_13015, partial [Fuerstia sp.]|nr:hypothetical protein [Fuerstiella sp.]
MRTFAPALLFIIQTSIYAQDLTWPDPVANHVVPMQSTSVTHGPVLGNVTSDSVRVWLRADSQIDFDVLVRPYRPPFDGAAITRATTAAGNDFTGFAEVVGLKPNTVYAYAVRVGNEIIDSRNSIRDPWPSFCTLPDETSYVHEFNPQGRFNFSFSIGACQRQRSPGE